MAGVIDTNVLLYAANKDAAEYDRARTFLMEAGNSNDQWYLTEGIVYEFLRVSTHPRVFPSPLNPDEATAFLKPFWTSDTFGVLQSEDGHWELLTQEIKALTHPSGNIFFDVRTVVLMREHGIRTIYTADTDFLQFKNIDVVNPMDT
ncbi:MAG: PIN domain-containing protein [Verrucomicrobia bacterium]|nr:PIN domain-containing protein [Verrucomicrobiota bacterium]